MHFPFCCLQGGRSLRGALRVFSWVWQPGHGVSIANPFYVDTYRKQQLRLPLHALWSRASRAPHELVIVPTQDAAAGECA